jgi:hypothetical protein
VKHQIWCLFFPLWNCIGRFFDGEKDQELEGDGEERLEG